MRALQLDYKHFTIRLFLPKSWSEKYPQSFYLLEEESQAWQKLITQKINWRFELALA
jgi:exopolyphosphatase/guanosine-5'-triphosphate,3'-diphosphate pyrophosphatase